MRERTWQLALVIGLSLSLANLAMSEGGTPGNGNAPQMGSGELSQPDGSKRSAEIARNPIAFQIPNRGAPKARIGGATRSAGTDLLPQIEALVPEQPGLTLRKQPVLYWYLASTTATPVEFVLLRLDPVKTVAEARIPPAAQAGVQAIDLAQYGVELEPGVSYQWLVKLVPDPADRSYDRIVGGGIERIAANSQLQRSLAAPGAPQAPSRYRLVSMRSGSPGRPTAPSSAGPTR